jgi:hypothetical protein
MLKRILSLTAMLTMLAYVPSLWAQHDDDHGGHYDIDGDHIDYHQPSHWDYHNGHWDFHQGHVDHMYPSTPIWTYPSFDYPSIVYPSTVYPSTVYPGSIQSTPSSSIVTNSVPVNQAPQSTRVVAGFTPNQAPIFVVNPKNYETTLAFNLNGQTVRLEPGKQWEGIFDRSYIIEFDRGNGNGIAKYTLRDGNFEFVFGDKGWDLKKTQPPANAAPQTAPTVLQNPVPSGG